MRIKAKMITRNCRMLIQRVDNKKQLIKPLGKQQKGDH